MFGSSATKQVSPCFWMKREARDPSRFFKNKDKLSRVNSHLTQLVKLGFLGKYGASAFITRHPWAECFLRFESTGRAEVLTLWNQQPRVPDQKEFSIWRTLVLVLPIEVWLAKTRYVGMNTSPDKDGKMDIGGCSGLNWRACMKLWRNGAGS